MTSFGGHSKPVDGPSIVKIMKFGYFNDTRKCPDVFISLGLKSARIDHPTGWDRDPLLQLRIFWKLEVSVKYFDVCFRQSSRDICLGSRNGGDPNPAATGFLFDFRRRDPFVYSDFP